MPKKRMAKKKSPKKKTQKPESGTTRMPDRRVMEGAMADLFRPAALSPLDEAQDLMYQAWGTAGSEDRIALARRALKMSADCADAYNLLAEETASNPEEALELYRKGVEAGERAIGERGFDEYDGHFWGVLETRPYMRALQGLADCLWALGKHDEAVGHYQGMLRLNPNDNQGIRYALVAGLVELGRDEEAESLLKQFDEETAVWCYTAALITFRRSGDGFASRSLLRRAIESNVHVPLFLLGMAPLPDRLPDHYGFGDESEAIICVATCGGSWADTEGALEWLIRAVAGDTIH